MHIIPQAARLSKAVRVYTNGNEEAAEAMRKAIEGTNLPATVESRRIAKFELKAPGSSTILVSLEGGEQNTEGFFVSLDRTPYHAMRVADLL